MNDKPCCYGECRQGRDCIQKWEPGPEDWALTFALALVIGLVVASVLI